MRAWHGRILVIATALVATLTGSFAWWDPFVFDDQARLREITAVSARSARADLAGDLRARIRAQADTASTFDTTREPERDDWERAAGHFLAHYPSFLLLQWVEPTYEVRWVAHRGPAVSPSRDVVRRPEVRRAVEVVSRGGERGDAAISGTFALSENRPAAAVVVPIRRTGRLDGFLVSVVDVGTLLDTILVDHLKLGYGIAVFDGSREIYRTSRGTGAHDERRWAHDLPLSGELAGSAWRIRVWPEPHTLAMNRSALPEVVMMLGALLVFAVLVTSHAAREQRSRATELGTARDTLESRVRERTAELQRANDSLASEVVVRTAAEASLRELSGRLLQLQDEERRRIARELHDSTAQTLAVCAVRLEKARCLARAGRASDLDAAFGDVQAAIEAASSELRTLSHLLHPPVLDELGLADALAWYANGFSERSGISVDLGVPSELGHLPRDVELTLFRLVQEGLTNVHRHSGSRCARVSLARNTHSVTLEIQDSGRGIPANVLHAVDGRPPSFGVGIAGMRERVRQLGGRMEITSTGMGTCIRTVLPIAASSRRSLVGEQAD